MSEGKLISFEGQDATGKTTLIYDLSKSLENRGIETAIVPEFSESETGRNIQHLLTQDKFIKPSSSSRTAYSMTMLVVADLFYLHEQMIVPAIESGKIVLKDRHIDTIYACEIPKVQEDYPTFTQDDLFSYFNSVLSPLYKPDQTFLLTLPLDEQKKRINERGEEIEERDLVVFKEREEIYRRLLRENPDRIKQYENTSSLEIATQDLTAQILRLI